jgi:hypothetical protein
MTRRILVAVAFLATTGALLAFPAGAGGGAATPST